MNNITDELEKIIEEINLIIQKKKDPFEINIKSLLKKLNELYIKLQSIEEYSKDAEAINLLATIVKEQSNYLYDKSSTLFLAAEKLIEKLTKISILEIGKIMEMCMYPIATTNFMNNDSIKIGYEYWLAKSSIRSERRTYETKINLINKDEFYYSDRKFINDLKKYEELILSKLPLNLTKEIENLNSKDKINLLYYLSFLIAQGKVHLVEKNEELYVDAGPSKFTNSIIFRIKL
jgi:hypothetical protein